MNLYNNPNRQKSKYRQNLASMQASGTMATEEGNLEKELSDDLLSSLRIVLLIDTANADTLGIKPNFWYF
jgi:hypothetical protein